MNSLARTFCTLSRAEGKICDVTLRYICHVHGVVWDNHEQFSALFNLYHAPWYRFLREKTE